MIAEYVGGPLDGQQCELNNEVYGIYIVAPLRVSSVTDDGETMLIREMYYKQVGNRLYFTGYSGYTFNCPSPNKK